MEIRTYEITAAQRELLRDLAGMMRNGIEHDQAKWAQVLQNIINSAVEVQGEVFA